MPTAGEGRVVKAQKAPLILLSGLNRDFIAPMIETARQWGWELRGSWLSSGGIAPERPVAGALTDALPDSPPAQRLRRLGCPAVRLGNRPHPGDHLLPAVLPDLAAGGRLAAQHFLSRGFKDVAYAGYDVADEDANMHAAYAAFRQCAGEQGMACCLYSIRAGDRPNEPDREGRRFRDLCAWLANLPKPVGVTCFNDIMAERIGLACARRGLKVPEEVAILGYGNALQCEITPVRLSSVDPGVKERVTVGMRLLRSLMEGKPPPTEPIMVPPAGIVERQSTDVLAVADPAVARTLRFIWDHFDDRQLTIGEIAASSGICRRTLERRFRGCLSRGLGAELRRKRLEQCRRLLIDSDLTTAEVAEKVGFSSGTYLHKTFVKAFGMTPGAYRRKTG